MQNLFDLEDLHWSFEDALFITPEGRYFIFGGGGMSAEVLKPLNVQKAGEWINAVIEQLNKLVKVESTKKEVFNSLIRESLKKLNVENPSLTPFLKKI